MVEIIKKVKMQKGYKMEQKGVKILWYADNAALLAENEDDLQRLLNNFDMTAKNST
jgi:hypothetical protein